VPRAQQTVIGPSVHVSELGHGRRDWKRVLAGD
jgi:hypothetical protein